MRARPPPLATVPTNQKKRTKRAATVSQMGRWDANYRTSRQAFSGHEFKSMSEYIARLLDAGDSFQWPEDGGGHRSFAALTAVLYLMACSLHNYRLRQRKHVTASKATPILDAASIAHNILLVAFSALVFAVAGYHFALLISSSGLRDFLCQPPLPAALPPTGFGLLNSLLGVGGGDVGAIDVCLRRCWRRWW